MNPKITSLEVQQFIKQNTHTDLNKLVLKGSPFKGVSIQEIAQQIQGRQKCIKKLPLWYGTKNTVFPKKINLEQSSSEITAHYKSELIKGESLIDLTGGFGVDCLYFSKKINHVTHCELNTELSNIARYNCQKFKVKNIEFHTINSFDYLQEKQIKFDWIYIDPSRRNEHKEKVFLLKDCIPNVPKNIEFLFQYSNHILVKTSPMLDITKSMEELKFVKEIHVIAVENEVKELLFILKKNHLGNTNIKTYNHQKKEKQHFNFEYGVSSSVKYSEPQKYLYEPNAAILKSGAFKQIAAQLKIDKLHKNAHLYTSKKLRNDFPGRTFRINQILNYDKKKILNMLPNAKANISTRNFPETVAQIRKKTKIKEGGQIYLFFTTDCSDKKIVLLCSKEH